MKTLLKTKLALLGIVLALVSLPFGGPTAHAQTSKRSDFLFPLATRTATANSRSINLNNHPANKVIAYLSSAAGTGTTPTLDVKLQDSPDGVIWADIASGAFAQVTGTIVSLRLAPAAAVGSFIRAVATITGTTPSFAFQVWITTYFSATASLILPGQEVPGYERDVGGRPRHSERAMQATSG